MGAARLGYAGKAPHAALMGALRGAHTMVAFGTATLPASDDVQFRMLWRTPPASARPSGCLA